MMRSTGRIGSPVLVAAVLLALLSPWGATPAQESRRQEAKAQESSPVPDPAPAAGVPTETPPLDLGLHEKAGITLLFLDVEVRDKKGRPVRGLSLDDFEVTIGGRLWPLEAVDDFCDCGTSAGALARRRARAATTMDPAGPRSAMGSIIGAPDMDKGSGPAVGPSAPVENPAPQHFVIYLDFSELQHTGRKEAESQARRWIEEGMQPGDQVMLAGFATATGLVEITPFTTDKDVLREGLKSAFTDKAFVDPFPLFFPNRIQDCPTCFASCVGDRETCSMECCLPLAKAEASQGRRALEALELFISGLENIPGRKQILYFNQNNSIYPQSYYPLLVEIQAWSVTDQMQTMERLGATATATRTAINVATMPFLAGITNKMGDGVVSFGANLADFSGGIASRTLYDLPTTLDRAGRECCMYRLSVRVPADPPRRTLRAKVAVRDRMLAPSYRVRFYTPQERWFRHALLALMTASRSSDSELQVALLPLARQEGKWSVEAQVGLALRDLELVPTRTERTGRWRVGALLEREDANETWEMLTLARATLQGKGDTDLQALHSRRIDGLKPGAYRLRAFLEDAELGTFWSREIELTLPGAGKEAGEGPWISDPVPARRTKGRLDLDLALVTNAPPVTSTVGAAVAGFVPMNETEVAAGALVRFRTLLCPGPGEDTKTPVVSILLHDGVPLARLPAARVEKAGECAMLTDTVDTVPLPPGDYTYRLMLNGGEEAPVRREAALTIRPAASL